jgi:hypothetical protein
LSSNISGLFLNRLFFCKGKRGQARSAEYGLVRHADTRVQKRFLDKPGWMLIPPRLLFLPVGSSSAHIHAFVCFLVTARIIPFPRSPASPKQPPARFQVQARFRETLSEVRRQWSVVRSPWSEVLESLQCYFRELRIFGKIFPPLFPLFPPVQILWLRLAALRLCGFALRFFRKRAQTMGDYFFVSVSGSLPIPLSRQP